MADEYYTVYDDIQNEINAYIDYNPDVFRDKTILLPCDDPEWSNFTKFFMLNFARFGIKELITTSYAYDSKNKSCRGEYKLTLFEQQSEQYDESKARSHGKVFRLSRTENHFGKYSINDLKWRYLDGDGDFRSEEVTALRDEADIIITNPPFSLFRKFIKWVFAKEKSFLVVGDQKAITTKDIFPLIKDVHMWLGATANDSDMVFGVPEGTIVNPNDKEKAEKLGYIGNYTRMGNACWFTNLDHGIRHKTLPCMTEARCIKFSKHDEIRENGYQKYDNYDAIEVPHVDSIPSDYDGVMGVPVTFLAKYNPKQFKILGCTQRGCHDDVPDTKKYDEFWEVTQKGKRTGSSGKKTNENANIKGDDGVHNYYVNQDGYIVHSLYSRIFIKNNRG